MKVLGIFLVCLFANKIHEISSRKCGVQLSQMLWTVCQDGFNGMMEKRSDSLQSALHEEMDSDLRLPYDSSSLSNIFQFEAGNLLTKTRRIRMMGIVDECCKKDCTISEFIAYCN